MPLAQPPPRPGLVSPAQKAWESLQDLAAGFFAGAPRVGIAALVFVIFLVIGRMVQRVLEPRLTRLRTPSFGRVFAALAYAGVTILGLVVALPIAFPSVSVATVLGGLGVLGLAAGFALQDIVSNLVAGILLIFRQPFVSGDQVEISDQKGTVEGISVRETRLRTFDGRLVIIPNKEVYNNTIEVQTAFEAVRTGVTVGVSYDTDLGRAREVALDTLAGVDGVLGDPAPEAYYDEFGDSAINLDLRFWTPPQQAEVRRVQDRVVEAIYNAFTAADIEIPFTTLTLDAGPSFDKALRGGFSSRSQLPAPDSSSRPAPSDSQGASSTGEMVQRVHRRLGKAPQDDQNER
ncbi:MAG: mechanosensitive ion channel family protein [Actinomycetota bacterium]|nr:mechanosensitive ion channel family protein [Actinomycetota bacterium]